MVDCNLTWVALSHTLWLIRSDQLRRPWNTGHSVRQTVSSHTWKPTTVKRNHLGSESIGFWSRDEYVTNSPYDWICLVYKKLGISISTYFYNLYDSNNILGRNRTQSEVLYLLSKYILRVVKTKVILFLEPMSERVGSDIERLWIWMTSSSIDFESS